MGANNSSQQLYESRKELYTMEIKAENLENLRQNLREAYVDYDIKSISKISEGGQATVFRIKCKVD